MMNGLHTCTYVRTEQLNNGSTTGHVPVNNSVAAWGVKVGG